MKLLADEGIDRLIVEHLRAEGHTVSYVAEMAPSTTDEEVLATANRDGSIVLSSDKDFGDLLFRQHRVECGVLPGKPGATSCAPHVPGSRRRAG